MKTRERAAWRQVGEDHPFLVSTFFGHDTVAYHSAQRTIGERYPLVTILGKFVFRLLLILGISAGIVWGWYSLPHEWLWGPALGILLLLLVPLFRKIWTRVTWDL